MADEEEVTVDGKPISELRVVDLKKELDQRGLSKAGTKIQLTERLKAQLLLEKRHSEALSTPQDDAKAPNLSLQDDEVTGQNDFIKQYLAQQQMNLERQMQFKKKLHEEQERQSAESTEESQASAAEEDAYASKEVTSSDGVKDASNAPAVETVESDMAKSRKSRHAAKEDKRESSKDEASSVTEKGNKELTPAERRRSRRRRSQSSEKDERRSRSVSRSPSRGQKHKRKSSRKKSRSVSPSSPLAQAVNEKEGKSTEGEVPSSTSRRSNRRSVAESGQGPEAAETTTVGFDIVEEEEKLKENASEQKRRPSDQEDTLEAGSKQYPRGYSKSPAEGRDVDLTEQPESKRMSRWRRSKAEEKPTDAESKSQENVTDKPRSAEKIDEPQAASLAAESKASQQSPETAEKQSSDVEKAKADVQAQKEKICDRPSDLGEREERKREEKVGTAEQEKKTTDREVGKEDEEDAAVNKPDRQVPAETDTEQPSGNKDKVVKEGRSEKANTANQDKPDQVKSKSNDDFIPDVASSDGDGHKEKTDSIDGTKAHFTLEGVADLKSDEITETTPAVQKGETESGQSPCKTRKDAAEEKEGGGLQQGSESQQVKSGRKGWRKSPEDKPEPDEGKTKSLGSAEKGEKMIADEEPDEKMHSKEFEQVRPSKRWKRTPREAEKPAEQTELPKKEEAVRSEDEEESRHLETEKQKDEDEKRVGDGGRTSDGETETVETAVREKSDSKLKTKHSDKPFDKDDKVIEKNKRSKTGDGHKEKTRQPLDRSKKNKSQSKRHRSRSTSSSSDSISQLSRSRSRSKSVSKSRSRSSSSSSEVDSKRNRKGSASALRKRQSRSCSPKSSEARPETADSCQADEAKGYDVHQAKVQRMVEKRDDKKESGGKSVLSDKADLHKADKRSFSQLFSDSKDDRDESGKTDATLDRAKEVKEGHEVETPKERPQRKRKWGSSKSSSTGRKTSLEISTELLKGLIEDVKLPTEPILELEISEPMIIEIEDSSQPPLPLAQEDKRDVKLKRTVVMPEEERRDASNEPKGDTRRIEASEDAVAASSSSSRKRSGSDEETKEPKQPRSQKLRIIKTEPGPGKELESKSKRAKEEESKTGTSSVRKHPDHHEDEREETNKLKAKKLKIIKKEPATPTEAESKVKTAVEGVKPVRRLSHPLVPADEPEKTNREPTPPRKPVNRVIHIINLVRPFTLGQLKELLSRTGTLVENGFWINNIKSHCFATYEKEEQAVATRKALHGARWPQSNPKTLRIEFSDKEEMERRVSCEEGTAAQPRPQPPAVKRETTPPPARQKEREKERLVSAPEVDKRKDRSRDRERQQEEKPVREWDRGKRSRSPERGPKSRSRSRERAREIRERERERERRHREQELKSKEKKEKKVEPPKVEEEPPAKLLDDLFRKTKATPCIYWLPLTEEQALKHLKEKEEQQAARRKLREENEEEEAAARRRRDDSRRMDESNEARDRRGRDRSDERERRRKSTSRDRSRGERSRSREKRRR